MNMIQGPRQGTRAHNALYKLHLMGGRASTTDLMNSILWSEPVPTFKREILGKLRGYDLVDLHDEVCSLTDLGIEFLGIDRDKLAGRVPAMAGPRTVASRGDLSEKNMVRANCGRPGAFDYREIPSRFGDQRIVFGTASVVTGVVKE